MDSWSVAWLICLPLILLPLDKGVGLDQARPDRVLGRTLAVEYDGEAAVRGEVDEDLCVR